MIGGRTPVAGPQRVLAAAGMLTSAARGQAGAELMFAAN
jgi:hypothetical protein